MSSPSESATGDGTRRSRRPLLLWIAGVSLGLILLLLLAWWQRLSIGRAAWSQVTERLADQNIHLTGSIRSIEWSSGVTFERLVLYEDAGHTTQLVALREVQIRPVRHDGWGARIRMCDSTAVLYTHQEVQRIEPIQLTAFVSGDLIEIDQLVARSGPLDFDLRDIRYEFSDDPAPEKKPKPDKERQSTAAQVEDLSDWLAWEVGDEGRFEVRVLGLKAGGGQLQRLQAEVAIRDATLSGQGISIAELQVSTEPAGSSVAVLGLGGRGIAWNGIEIEDPFTGTIAIERSEIEIQVSLPRFELASNDDSLIFEEVELRVLDPFGSLQATLDTARGRVGETPILPLHLSATRHDQVIDLSFGGENETGEGELLHGTVRWDEADERLSVPRLVSHLDLWHLAGALRPRDGIFSNLEATSTPQLTFTDLELDFGAESLAITGTIEIDQGAAFYWRSRDLAFAVSSGVYHLEGTSIGIDGLQAEAFGGPIAADGRFDWSDPKQPLLALDAASLEVELAQVAELAQLHRWKIALGGRATLVAENVRIPLNEADQLTIENFALEGGAEVRYGEGEQIIPARVSRAVGEYRSDGIDLDSLAARIFGGDHIFGPVTIDWSGENARLEISHAEGREVNLAALGRYLDSEAKWNFRLGGTTDVLVSEVVVPFDDPARTRVAAFSNNGRAEVTILHEGRELPLIAYSVEGSLDPGELVMISASSGLEEGVLGVSGLDLRWEGADPALFIAGARAEKLPLEPVAHFLDVGRWNLELGGTTTAEITGLHLPLDDPARLTIEAFAEAGSVTGAYRLDRGNLDFAVDEVAGRYAPGGVDFEGLRGRALGGPAALGETQIRWGDGTQGVAAAAIEGSPELARVTRLFGLEERRLRLEGSPTVRIDQFALDFNNPGQADLDTFAIEGDGTLAVRIGDNRWMPIGMELVRGRYNPGEVEFEALRASLFDGTSEFDGAAANWQDGLRWSLPRFAIDDLDLSQLAILLEQDPDGPLQGNLDVGGSFAGSSDPTDLQGAARLLVTDGNFYSMPILGPLDLLLGRLVPNLPADVARNADLQFGAENGVLSAQPLVIESAISRVELTGTYNLDTRWVEANASVNLRSVAGIATFLLSEALTVHGEGPVDDVSYSFTFLPMPGLDQLEQLEQLPQDFLQLPGVRELPQVQRIPVFGEVLGTVNNVRELPLLREIPFLGRSPEDIEENGDDGARSGIFETLNPFDDGSEAEEGEPVEAVPVPPNS